MENHNLKKAILHRFGSLTCPYCNKWLAVRIEAKVIPGILVCRFCGKEMLADEKTCQVVNAYNTSLRNTLYYPKKVVIYEGCKNGKTE